MYKKLILQLQGEKVIFLSILQQNVKWTTSTTMIDPQFCECKAERTLKQCFQWLEASTRFKNIFNSLKTKMQPLTSVFFIHFSALLLVTSLKHVVEAASFIILSKSFKEILVSVWNVFRLWREILGLETDLLGSEVWDLAEI